MLMLQASSLKPQAPYSILRLHSPEIQEEALKMLPDQLYSCLLLDLQLSTIYLVSSIRQGLPQLPY